MPVTLSGNVIFDLFSDFPNYKNFKNYFEKVSLKIPKCYHLLSI